MHVHITPQIRAYLQICFFFGRGVDLQRRWPRLVQTLGVSEDRALEIVETDVTPLPLGLLHGAPVG